MNITQAYHCILDHGLKIEDSIVFIKATWQSQILFTSIYYLVWICNWDWKWDI